MFSFITVLRALTMLCYIIIVLFIERCIGAVFSIDTSHVHSFWHSGPIVLWQNWVSALCEIETLHCTQLLKLLGRGEQTQVLILWHHAHPAFYPHEISLDRG